MAKKVKAEKPGKWSHPKYGTGYKATYETTVTKAGDKERTFVLTGKNSKGRKVVKSYDSHEEAKIS